MALTKASYSMIDGASVNVLDYGADPTGSADSTVAIQTAVSTAKVVYIPAGTYKVTDTITVGPNGCTLIGPSPSKRAFGSSYAEIIYDGVASSTKAVIVVGANNVGVDPTTSGSSNVVKNIYINANNKAGFGIYGVFLTNDCMIDNVGIVGSTEFNGYFGKSWFATYTNITSIACKGKGLAFGMPLILQNGTNLASSWVASNPYEMNQTSIDNVRSHSSGQYYSVDNAGLYDPTNATHRMQGYGIGAGIGNGFTMTNFQAERSGGTNLYVYTDFQPRKVLQYGYLEGACYNSGLAAATAMANIIFENVAAPAIANDVDVRDVLCNFNSGGIFHTGALNTEIRLTNIHQPRFLSSLDGASDFNLFASVLKNNVYFLCGEYNTNPKYMSPAGYGVVDTSAGSFTVDVLPTGNSFSAVYIKYDGTAYYGGYFTNYDDGTSNSFAFPTLTTSYQLDRVLSKGIVSITKSGVTGGTTNQVTFKVLTTDKTS